MEWDQVINNPFLKDLPFKIELNRWGKILMSPASNSHGHIQFEIGAKIKEGKKGQGKVITECSIQTSQGVKVADVAWISDEFFAQYGYDTPYKRAPEICVEIVSSSNSKAFPPARPRPILQVTVAKTARFVYENHHQRWCEVGRLINGVFCNYAGTRSKAWSRML